MISFFTKIKPFLFCPNVKAQESWPSKTCIKRPSPSIIWLHISIWLSSGPKTESNMNLRWWKRGRVDELENGTWCLNFFIGLLCAVIPFRAGSRTTTCFLKLSIVKNDDHVDMDESNRSTLLFRLFELLLIRRFTLSFFKEKYIGFYSEM